MLVADKLRLFTPTIRESMVKIVKEIKSGCEFKVFELEDNEVLKIPRFPRLMYFAFGNFRKKSEYDLQFLQMYFTEFLPSTEIIEFGKAWAIRQQRIYGKPFFENPEMSSQARILFSRAERIFRLTGKIPDLFNPGNLLQEHKTGRLFLVDTSVLGRRKWWPIGYLVTRLFAKILLDSIHRWLRTGF